jgi:hypothetical protein
LESTQDGDAEAQDVPLFVANARDVVRHYRTHPSIVLWFGRNEGVPQPALQNALQEMVWQEDGTRLYKGNSRIINLAGSGPYEWHKPEDYFTSYPRGFAVEVGTSSFPTLEAWQRTVPAAADRWPISDAWVYHDWHQERGVSMASFTHALESEFGPAKDLKDFERKAQMLNYESHRAIFEGFNAGLWTRNSAHAVDDASGLALGGFPDLFLGLRHACRFLWHQEGCRAGPYPDEPARPSAGDGQHHADGGEGRADGRARDRSYGRHADDARSEGECRRQRHGRGLDLAA